MESAVERLARIEEIVKRTERSVMQIQKTVPHLFTEVELLKRDSKWRHAIVMTVGAVLGSASGFLAEMLRK